MKKKLILILILIPILLIICLFIDKKTSNTLTLYYNEEVGAYTVYNPDNLSITYKNYQNDISKLIYNKLNDKLYLANNPLLILNPYGTNITGLYINFFTFTPSKVEYTISVDDPEISDFTNTLGSGWTNFHKGQIIGLIQGYENNITIKIIDKYSNVKKMYKFNVNMPEYNTKSIKKINSSYNELSKISDGLYLLCSIRNIANQSLPLSFYDVNGILRAEFTSETGKASFRVEFIENKLLYAIDSKQYVLVNHLGKIEKTYQAKHTSNHDFIYYKYDNSILYINDTDKIRKLDLDDNQDTQLLDLGVLLNEYKDMAIQYYKENYDYYKDVDWLHLNSIEIVNHNDIVLSSRNNSSIIYISNINTNPEIKYIIAPSKIYQNTSYEKYLLKQIGDFPVHAGQHSVLIEYDDKLEQDQYYLIFYNNHFASGYVVFNDDYTESIKGVGTANNDAENSMYYKYLIDESKFTFELVDSIDVKYSRSISNVQVTDTSYIINSGRKFTIQEYDMNKNQVLTLSSDKINVYRAYKYDMKSFWFDSMYHYTELEEHESNNSSINEEENKSEFYYNEKTNTITGVNPQSNKFKESDLIYHDTIYFTLYDYESETLIIPSNIDGTQINKILGLNIANVKKIIVEEGIEEIGNYAFFGAKNVEEIILPSTLKKIGRQAFGKCTNIKKITIPDGVNYIGEFAFYGWKSNQTIIVKEKSTYENLWQGNSKAKLIEF